MAIEEQNLKHHINTRALKLLQVAETIEITNQRTFINNIINAAIAEVDNVLTDNLAALQDGMFEAALIGIKEKKMTYKNDPFLPLIKDKIQKRIRELNGLTEDE